MAFAGQVMLASVAGVGNAYAQLDVAGPPDIYYEFDVMFPQASLDAWQAGVYSPYFVQFTADPGGFPAGIGFVQYVAGAWKWVVDDASPVSTVLGDTEYRVGFHYDELAGEVTFRLAGVDLATATDAGSTIGDVRLGLIDTLVAATAYFDNVTASAIAWGGTDLLDNDFETAIVPDFTSTTGGVSRVAAPAAEAPQAIEGVVIAFDDPLLEPDPTWTRIDNQVRVARWEIRRGRQGELEKTNTAEATVTIHDTEGWFDAYNPSSPWDGMLDGKQLALARWNPVTEEWSTRFRGYITGYTYSLSPTQQVMDVEIRAVGFMGYLARAEMLPGAGHAGGPADMVFYDEQDVDDRINLLHDDAGLPTALYVTFSGNVVLQETLYDPGYSFLAGVQDAADGEFPGVANVYEDRFGRVVFHGRHARFSPDAVAADAGTDAWDFQRWKAGDGDAITGDSDYAQVRPPLNADRPLDLVINSALVTPLGIEPEDVAGQIVTDAVSFGKFGTGSYSATDLRVLEHKTNGDTGLQQCLKIANYYVANYAVPYTRPRQITLRSLRATDARAASTWALICGIDVSDVVHLKVTNPGGAGFDEDFFVEGISEVSAPLGPFTPVGAEMDLAEIVLDVSPVAFYNEDTFTDDAT